MKLKQVQLHTPLFLGRTNLGDKLDSMSKQGLFLTYVPDEQMVYVEFNGETGMIHVSGTSCLVAMTGPPAKIAPQPKISRQPAKAQVSTPQGDLLTPGQGRTGQE